ncbi:MAG: nucleotidyl transferase AbiEii/AbiGii toxin family protein [Planctomycetota bacterium]
MRVATAIADNIRISSMLSKLPMIGREQKWEVTRMVPGDLIPALKAADIEFMLVGAHGVSVWMSDPRATQDVDFIVRVKDKVKASNAILGKFPALIQEKNPDVWRYQLDGKYLVDLILTTTPLHKRVFTEFSETRVDRLKVRVPKVESALAMKFAAMTGHYRNLVKKYKDASDFIDIATLNKVDLPLLKELGELVFSGGGEQIVKYLGDARAGNRLEI